MHISSEILKRHNTLKIRTNASSFFKLIREVCLIISMTTLVEHNLAQSTECLFFAKKLDLEKYCPMVYATPITIMGSIMGLFPLRNGVYLVTAIR